MVELLCSSKECPKFYSCLRSVANAKNDKYIGQPNSGMCNEFTDYNNYIPSESEISKEK